MLFNNVRIESIGYELGPERVTSLDLEEQFSNTMARLQIRPGTLEAISGIHERRLWPLGTKPSAIGTVAAQKAIEAARIDPAEIGCLISTSVMRDYIEPSTACLIHGNLRLPGHCMNYDLSNACLGFINGMYNVGMMIESRAIKYGLVVAGEAGRELLEATIRYLSKADTTKRQLMENLATLTLGEGAVAMILSHKDRSKTNHQLHGSVSVAATEYNQLCVADKTLMKTNPAKLLTAGTELIARTLRAAEALFGPLLDDQIKLYVPHQVSSQNTAAVARRLNVAHSKIKLTFPMLGNTGPVGMPTALALADENREINTGDRVCLLGIGSGLNATIMNVTW